MADLRRQRERARELFPQVLLGVLGIIQALAFELIWQKGVGGLDAWRAADAWLAGVLQVVAILLGVILVWVMYANMVLRFTWTPRFRDLVTPFVIGVAEFLVIEWMTPDRLAAWFAGLAGIFVVAMATSLETFRGGILLDEAHADEPPLREHLASYVPGTVTLVALLACALLVHWAGPSSWVAVGALLAANAGVLAQLSMLRRFWNEEARQR